MALRRASFLFSDKLSSYFKATSRGGSKCKAPRTVLNYFIVFFCCTKYNTIHRYSSLFQIYCVVLCQGDGMHLWMFADSSLSQSFLYPRTQLPDSTRMDSILWTSQPGVQNASSLSIFIFSFPFFGTQKCFLVNLSWSSTRICTDISSQQVHSYGNLNQAF